MGTKKLPKMAGMLGMMNRKIMMAPCRVNTLLYWLAVMMVLPGAISSVRTSRAMTPPRKNAAPMLII